jgi:hypothetical protein
LLRSAKITMQAKEQQVGEPRGKQRPGPGVKSLTHALVLAAALLLLAEEWLWDQLKAWTFKLRQYQAVRRFEARMRLLPPWAALLVLATPAALIFPFKLVAVWAMVHGHPLLGLLTLVSAKLAGTAAMAYLLDLVRDSARRLRWFDALYVRITTLLVACKAWVRCQPAYKAARARVAALRHAVKGLLDADPKLARKFRAARTVSRRWRCCLVR